MTEIIAHRGSSFDAPENTLAAVRLAWEQGADAVEVDVRMTADGKIVALHDADLRRTAGVDARIDSLRLSELQAIDVGRWKSEQFTGERIPTLEALLATIVRGKWFFVEIKCGPEIVEELLRIVRSSPIPSAIVPIGFSLPLMQAIKQRLSECKVHGVFDFEPDHAPNPTTHKQRDIERTSLDHEIDAKPLARDGRLATEELIACAQTYNLDGVDLDGSGPISKSMVDSLHTAGLDVCAWTVDAPQRARQLIAAGVSGITTNRPQWLRRELGL